MTNFPQYILSLPQAGLILIDTPSSHHKTAYKYDLAEFRSVRGGKKRAILRNRLDGEFQDSISPLRGPALWIFVVSIDNGVHIKIPIYRGVEFFNTRSLDSLYLRCTDAVSDSEISNIVQSCIIRGGLDTEEWFIFLANLDVRNGN